MIRRNPEYKIKRRCSSESKSTFYSREIFVNARSIGMTSIEYPSGVIDLGNEFYMPCHSLYIDLFSRYVTVILMIYTSNEHRNLDYRIYIIVGILINLIVRII